MAENTVYVRAPHVPIASAKASLKALIKQQLPQMARAGGPIANVMMTRCGMALLGRIREAFVVKARGGTDEAGDSWKPLSPKTIAYSKTRRRGRTEAEKKRPSHPSQALNTKQRNRWWQVYSQGLARFKGDKSHAAAVAWIVLKSEGAQTLVDKYGNQQVKILRDRGFLLNSLSPGAQHSVFRVGPGYVVVGTNREGAAAHHKGVPGKLPQRRLWPPPENWPKSWWDDILKELQKGYAELAAVLIKMTKT